LIIKSPDRVEVLSLCADLLEYPDETHKAKVKRLGVLLDDTTCQLDGWTDEEIEAEHLQLFSIGASQKRTVLHAGWWRDGQLRGPTYRTIEAFYTDNGYALDPDEPLVADHLSAMLRFLSILIEEGQMESAKAFSRFLTWLNDFEKSLESTSVLCSFSIVAHAAATIVNTINET
jgi:TorA maturation chaperone TorD